MPESDAVLKELAVTTALPLVRIVTGLLLDVPSVSVSTMKNSLALTM